MLDTLSMPPAGGLDETDEQKRARLLTPNVMPPAGTPAPPQPSTNVMPPAGQPQPQPAAPTNVMPPAPAQPSQPPPPANAMPPAMVAPAQQKPPELHGWKKALDAVGSVFPIGRAIESAIPGTPQNWELEQGKQSARDEKQAEIQQKTSAAAEAEGRARLTDEQAKQLGNMVPVTLPNGQTIYLNEKDATAIMGKQVQGDTSKTVQGMKGTTAETVQGMKGDTAESIQGQKGDTAVTVQGMKDDATGSKAPTTKTVMVNGKPTVMGWNPETKAFDIPFGEAPPSYASAVMPTKTIDTIDENGMPAKMGWNEQTKKYDIPMGVSSAGAAGGRIVQANVVTRAADGLISDIKANKDKLGNMKAIVESAILNTPWADPETAQLRTEIASFAALNPAMHGFRGTDALREFEKIIGGIPNSPEAMIASLEGIKKTAGAFSGSPSPAKGELPAGAVRGKMNGKPGYVLNGVFHGE